MDLKQGIYRYNQCMSIGEFGLTEEEKTVTDLQIA